MVWLTLFRFVTTTGVKYSEELTDELQIIVESHLPKNISDIKTLIHKNAQITGTSEHTSKFERDMDNARNQALKKIGTEIGLFVQSLKNHEQTANNKTQSNTFNIYSPVGAIQTGANSVSYVTQQIDSETREKLKQALIIV